MHVCESVCVCDLRHFFHSLIYLYTYIVVLQVVRRLFTTHRLAFEKKATEYVRCCAKSTLTVGDDDGRRSKLCIQVDMEIRDVRS